MTASKTIEPKTAYIVMKPADVRRYMFQADREYFSKPVLVEIVGTTESGLLKVTDHKRGHTYPCSKSSLKSKWSLTHRQLAAAESA